MSQSNSKAARSGQTRGEAPAERAEPSYPDERNRPVHEVRLGAIKAALWANEGAQGVFYNATVGRVYKDREGRWQTTTTFGRDDLLVLAKVADLAHTWICEQAQGGSHEAGEGTG
ncbi:MAG: hypothetical protein U0790_02050 [Isosphaeraceae bacterium]